MKLFFHNNHFLCWMASYTWMMKFLKWKKTMFHMALTMQHLCKPFPFFILLMVLLLFLQKCRHKAVCMAQTIFTFKKNSNYDTSTYIRAKISKLHLRCTIKVLYTHNMYVNVMISVSNKDPWTVCKSTL